MLERLAKVPVTIESELACSNPGLPKPDFGDLEEESDEEGMSASDLHMQEAIEASLRGENPNPSIDEAMFGAQAPPPRVSLEHKEVRSPQLL